MKNGQILPVKLGGYECIGSPVLIVDPQTTAILDANESACKFYGHTHAEFVQMKIMDISMISLEESWQRIRRDSAGDVNRLFTQHRLANGKICDVEVYFGRGNLEDKPVSIATVHDITEREQTKNKLEKSEENYRLLFQNMREGFSLYELIIDHDGKAIDARILTANAAYENHTGLKPLEVIGRTILEVMPQTDLKQLEPYIKVAQTGEPISLEYFSTAFQRHYRTKVFCPQPGQFASIVEDITERKQAEQALRESEERFSTVFHSSHDAISIARLSDDIYLDVNEAFCRVFGVSRDQVIGRVGRELNIAANPEQRKEIMSRLLSQGQVSNIESQFRNHMEQTGWLLISAQIVKIFEQDCIVIFGKDITLRKQAEAALQSAHHELELRVQERTVELRRSLERLNLATGSANMGIWDWDIQKNELVWDRQMYALYGVNPEDFGGAYEAWLGGVYPDDRQHSDEFAQRALRGEVTYDTEIRVLWPDGSTHWLKSNGQVFWDEQGEPVRMLGVNYDITERKHLEAELRENEQKYMALFKKAAVPAALTKMPEGVFVEVNEAFQGAFGYMNDEIYYKTSVDIGMVKPEERAETYMELERHGFVQNNEKHLLTKTGETRDCLINANPVSFNGQDFVITTIADVTERKQAETRLVETNIALEKALRVKDGFLAAISHELRTPLTGIMGMTEMLQLTAASALNPRQVEYLANIQKSGERLLSLINNLLEFTRLQSAVGTLEFHPCRLAEVCQTSLHKIAASAEAKHQRVHFSPPSSEIVIQTDERLLFKSLFLLLDNASKFTAEGGEFGIEITERAGSGLVDITVWDTGIGIAEEHLQNLFQPFMQLDASLARQYDGAGLGLALVKGTIELLNGTVSAQSTLGKGSRFIVTLPWNISEMV